MRVYSRAIALLLLAVCSSQSVAGSIGTEEGLAPAPLSLSLPPGINRLELTSGQIAVTDSGGPTALFFSLFAEEFSPFVHAGIIVMEEGEAMVYESFGVFQMTFGGRPTDYISGKVSRTPLATFVRRGKYVKIYHPPPAADPQKIAAFAVEHFRRETPFDPYFRFGEHHSFYCTELVALAVEAAGGAPSVLEPFPNNPSLNKVRQWLGITDSGTVQARQFMRPERLVGTLSVVSSQSRFPVLSTFNTHPSRKL